MIRLITDGACEGNPGPGGWAAILISETNVEELGGFEPHTTNNRMELRAAIEGLRKVPASEPVQVVTDSQYLLKGITEWLPGWKRRGWRTSNGNAVENRDLWEELDSLVGSHVTWEWVHGHAGHPENERADQIAQAYSKSQPVPRSKLRIGEPSLTYDVDPSSCNRPPGESYLSLVNGVLMRHRTWGACEAHIKGISGAKTKKCRSLQEEINVVQGWGLDVNALQELASQEPIKTPELSMSASPSQANIDLAKIQRPNGITYLSLVNGKLARHTTWAECEARTRGISGVKLKKCRSLAEELATVAEWGLKEDMLLELNQNSENSSLQQSKTDTHLQQITQQINRPAGTTYLSFVDGILIRHLSWEECQARVNGISSPKYKKCKTVDDEVEWVQAWGLPVEMLVAISAGQSEEKISPESRTPHPILLPTGFLEEAKNRLSEAGFSSDASNHPDAAFRMRLDKAIVEAYRNGKVQFQGVWSPATQAIWNRIVDFEAAWIEKTLQQALDAHSLHTQPIWDLPHIQYLRALLYHSRLPGWNAEPIGRYLYVSQAKDSRPISILGEAEWRKHPQTEVSAELWRCLQVARRCPDRWCAALFQPGDVSLSLAVLPLTIEVQHLSQLWDWNVANKASHEEQLHILNYLGRWVPVSYRIRWSHDEWKPMAKKLGNQWDLIYSWLSKQILTGSEQLGFSLSWPLELISEISGNTGWAERLVEQRTDGQIRHRKPVMSEEITGLGLVSFLNRQRMESEK